MKPRLRDLLKARKAALSKAPPQSRDRLRHRVMVLEKVARLKREVKAA
jgi:hypothetical protein